MNSKGESGGDARIMQSTDSYFLQLSVIRFQSISDQAGESQKGEVSFRAVRRAIRTSGSAVFGEKLEYFIRAGIRACKP